MNGWKSTSVAVAAALGMASVASADTVLQLDLNSLLTTGGAGFSTSFTGTLTIVDDSDSALVDIFIDGVAQNIPTSMLKDMSGEITLVSGDVTGGFLDVVAWSVTAGSGDFNTYHATIVDGFGEVVSQTTGFAIDGLTFSGTFSSTSDDTVFATVDVTDWDDVEPLNGSFVEFAYDPNTSGVDDVSDMDIFIVIPLPTTAGMGLAGLLGIGLLRRRRD